MKYVPTALTQKFARQTLTVQKNSPQLLFGAGIIAGVGSTVLACRATLKLEDVLAEAQGNLELAKSIPEGHPKYSEAERSRDVGIIYVRSVGSVAKLYAPSVALGVVSIACLTQSHNILNKRNAALGAAYAAVEKGFSEYRERVVEKYGEDQDRDFRYGTEKVQIKDDATGKVKTVTRVSSDDEKSMYARMFDTTNNNWNPEPDYNLLFLRCTQNWANDMLRLRGHLFLNEVYDQLGMDRRPFGQLVGWVWNGEASDNYVDFGLFDIENEGCIDFNLAQEGAILLDFNVDGVVYDLIGKKNQ